MKTRNLNIDLQKDVNLSLFRREFGILKIDSFPIIFFTVTIYLSQKSCKPRALYFPHWKKEANYKNGRKSWHVKPNKQSCNLHVFYRHESSQESQAVLAWTIFSGSFPEFSESTINGQINGFENLLEWLRPTLEFSKEFSAWLTNLQAFEKIINNYAIVMSFEVFNAFLTFVSPSYFQMIG